MAFSRRAISIFGLASLSCGALHPGSQSSEAACDVGGLNECGVCFPAIPDLGVACMASNGCQGTRVCSADGTHADCKTSVFANECGVCGGAHVDGVRAICTTTGGKSGIAMCSDAGDGTVCASTVVTLTFDDTFSDTFQAGAMLEMRGMRGVFYVNSPRFVRGAHYMTLPQVLDLQSRGHEIGGHTLDHPHLPLLSPDAQKAEICNDRAALLNFGLDVRHFAYPFGENDDATRAAAQFCNYNSARGVGNLYDSAGNHVHAEAYAPVNVFDIRANSSVVDETPLDTIKGRVLDAEMANGGWVIINMHHVCATCGRNEIHVETLNAFLDWLAPRTTNGTYVRTIRHLIPGDAQPPVIVHAAVIVPNDAGTAGVEGISLGGGALAPTCD